MVRPYPPQPPSQLPSTLGYNNIAPAPSHASYLRNAPPLEARALAHHAIPQQYAHPLSRHNAYGSPPAEPGRTPKPAEHMLRRKTPNGILAAAYDGTSVEQSGEPHATKHILLPVTAESSIPYGLKQDLPLRSPALHAQNHRDPAEWSASRYFETGSGLLGQHLPQIDSMLNQIPPLQPLEPYQMYAHPFCGPMGPPFQTPLNPTVSNDQGPYGPYWHDGTYIPYRPAAMRDPRFLLHHTQNWTHPRSNPFLGHPYSNVVPTFSHHQQNPVQLDYAHGAYAHPPRPQLDFQPFGQPPPNPALDYQNQPLPPPLTQRPQDFLHSGQTTPVAEHMPSLPLTDFGTQSPAEQPRDKVFAWAHAVYVDMLRHLQATRKATSHSHGRVQHRPHIYPKPPRQPGGSSSLSPHPSLERRVSYPAPNHYVSPHSGAEFAPKRPQLPHSRSVSAWSMGAPDPSGQPWQGAVPLQHPMLPHVSAIEPPRTLRRMSGSVASAHQSLQHVVPPSVTTASALETITKHCEESKWTWIDGMLLGGCLAYALGDYQKAQDWYKHILTLDKE